MRIDLGGGWTLRQGPDSQEMVTTPLKAPHPITIRPSSGADSLGTWVQVLALHFLVTLRKFLPLSAFSPAIVNTVITPTQLPGAFQSPKGHWVAITPGKRPGEDGETGEERYLAQAALFGEPFLTPRLTPQAGCTPGRLPRQPPALPAAAAE